jgi:hypothetical protein
MGNPVAEAPGNTPALWPVPGSSSSGIVSSESDSVPDPDTSPLGSVIDAVALSNSVNSGIVTTCYRSNQKNVAGNTHTHKTRTNTNIFPLFTIRSDIFRVLTCRKYNQITIICYDKCTTYYTSHILNNSINALAFTRDFNRKFSAVQEIPLVNIH